MLSYFRPIRPNLIKSFTRYYSPRVRASPLIRRTNLAEEPFALSQQLTSILDEPVLVIERQLEIGSILAGWEQSRIFMLYKPDGTRLGHLEETDLSLGRTVLRQITRLHRPFTVRLFDVYGNFLLTIQRPFSFINSEIKCFTHNEDLIGESQQEWHLWRRRYNLYLAENNQTSLPNSDRSDNDVSFNQFGRVDAPFLSFQFPVDNERGETLGLIDRNWTGIGREMFTDTGVYFLRFSPDRVAETLLDPSKRVSQRPLSLSERVVMLGTSISVDFDYFSRHSSGPHSGVFFMGGNDV